MSEYSLFLSVVVISRNQAEQLQSLLAKITATTEHLVTDWEIIVIDNASNDESILQLKELANINGLPNLQVYALTKEVDSETASWVGLENALGDFVAVIDPRTDDIDFLPKMLSEAATGSDVVFAINKIKQKNTIAYNLADAIFNRTFKIFTGVDLAKEAPKYRLISRKVINFILRHAQPATMYRLLPATGGFTRKYLEYSSEPYSTINKNLWESIDRGLSTLVSTTKAPIRLVTSLSLLGAAANLLYSLYVVFTVITRDDIAQGWASMSLQISGMFFLISLVLLVLGEYILHVASLSNEGPAYHISQEFCSAKITRKDKLNIEEIANKDTLTSR